MEMRELLNRVRNNGVNKKHIDDTESKNLDVREMLKRTKKAFLREDEAIEKTIKIDQANEEEKFRDYFRDLEVVVDFIELEVYDNGIFWGGTIDGVIQFVYKVTSNEKESGFDIYYLEDFDKNNEDNQEIARRIETYYDEFFKFWRDNILN
jgi:hypothetical protein